MRRSYDLTALVTCALAALMFAGCGPKDDERPRPTDPMAAVDAPPTGPSGHMNPAAEDAAQAEPPDDLTTELPVAATPLMDNADVGGEHAADATGTDAGEQDADIGGDQPSDAAPATDASAADDNDDPESMRELFNRGIETVRATGIEDSALGEGDEAIDGELIDATGESVRLSELWNTGPLVVVWYRGGWCPFCNKHLAALQEALPEIEDAGGRLVAVTPELPESAADTIANNDLSYQVLTDQGNALARKYGIVFKLPDFVEKVYREHVQLEKYNGEASYELPLAAVYVIDREGKIRYAFLEADYTKRADPAEIVEALEAL